MSRNMKDSGVTWLGMIPDAWDVSINKTILQNVSVKNHPDDEVLSLYRDLGIVPKNSRDDNHNVTSENTEQYKFVECGDLVINKMKAWQGSLAVSEYEGIVSPAYYVCKFKNDKMDKKYIHHLLRSCIYAQQFECLSTGMRIGQWDLSIDDFLTSPLLIPPKEEQIKIAVKIDVKCSQVDTLIENQQKQIEKLKQYKQSLITEVVTKGLNPALEMKDSGIEWIGVIPKKASVIHLRHIADIETGNMDTQNSVPDGEYPLYVRSPIVERSYTYTFDDKVAILMAGDGAGAGRIFHLVSGKYGCHQRVYRMNNFKYIIPKLLKYYLEVMFPIIMAQGSAKSTVDSVRLPMLKSFPVVVTEETEQIEMVTFLDDKCNKIDSLIAIKEQKIEKLQQYKKSIIYEYVTGKKEAL